MSGLGLPLQLLTPDVDESRMPNEPPVAFLERIVSSKLSAILGMSSETHCACALVADTIVVVDGEILGKPEDVLDAERLLNKICGRSHTVMTRYAICGLGPTAATEDVRAQTVSTEVRLRGLPQAARRAYAESGEGLDKAGAYAAQGLGAFLIESLNGSYTNVVGLPVCQVVADLTAGGFLSGYPEGFRPRIA